MIAGTAASGDKRAHLGPLNGGELKPISSLAFLGVAVASFGGPLALAALAAPGLVADAASSSAATVLVSIAIFMLPLAIWLRYSSAVAGSAGLTGFVEAAAGRRVALIQASVWIISYVLYLIYTTIQIVYDLLPSVVAGERHYQAWLALGIPLAMTGVMIAGRKAALVAIGLIAATQLTLAGMLDGVTVAHLGVGSAAPAPAPAGTMTKAGAQTSLLYICGSLPLFLGGELARPHRAIRRGLIIAFLVTAGVVFLAVAPLAALPGLLRTDVPGVAVAQAFSGAGVATAIGIGVAVSIAGVMLCEYLALSRLTHAVCGWPIRAVVVAIGFVVLAAAPFSLSDPEGFYSTLITPSVIALWLSQLIVVGVYPLFARRRGRATVPACALSLGASALMLYGLWTSIQSATT